jgi:hypothetical protein
VSDPTSVHIDDLTAALTSLGIDAGADLRTVVIARGQIHVTRWPSGATTSETTVIRIDTAEREETR